MIAPVIPPERTFRGPHCTDACAIIRVLIPGVFGRSELLVCDPDVHFAAGVASVISSLPQEALIVTTGTLSVDLTALVVTVDGSIVRLTATELRLLCHLARRIGAACTKDEIVEAVWGTRTRGAHQMLRTNINRLRGSLGVAGSLIDTIGGIGYRLDRLPPGVVRPRFLNSLVRRGCWSVEWDRCRNCGKTDLSHWAHGYCQSWQCRNQARKEARP